MSLYVYVNIWSSSNNKTRQTILCGNRLNHKRITKNSL